MNQQFPEDLCEDKRGNCDPTSNMACPKGCWFLYSAAGCKQGSRCPYCHNTICCLLADIRRREFRREQSRRRPSKKKRDRYNRCRTDTCSTVSDSDQRVDQHFGVLNESIFLDQEPRPRVVPDNLIDIQNLMDMISRGC